MTTKIGGIVIDIDARLTNLEKSLAKGERELKKFERESLASMSKIEAGILKGSKAVGTIVGTLGGLGVAIGLGSITQIGKDSLAMADDLATAADQALINVERFQTLREVFRTLEVDGEMFDKAMLRLVTTLGEVQAGTESGATRALQEMGIQSRILSGEIDTTDELLDAIADSAKSFGTEAQFTAAIVEIFGKKAGPQFAAAMREGSTGIKSMEEDVRRFGDVLTEQQINKLADANEAIERFEKQSTYYFALAAANVVNSLNTIGDAYFELKRYLAQGLTLDGIGLPPERKITAISNQTNAARAELQKRQQQRKSSPGMYLYNPIQRFADDNRIAKLKNTITAGEKELKGLIDGQRKIAEKIPAVSLAAQPIKPPRGGGGGGRSGGGARAAARETDTYAKSMEELSQRLADVQLQIDATNNDLDEAAKGYWEAKRATDALIASAGAQWSEERKRAYRLEAESVAGLEAGLKRLIDRRKEAADIDPVAEGDIPQMFQDKTLEDVVREMYGDAFVDGEKFKKGVLQQTGEIADAFSSMVANVEGSISDLSDAIKDGDFLGILQGVLNSVSSVTSLIGGINSITKGQAFADGTNFAPGGVALVGERGPELVHLPRGSKVTPNHSLPWGDLNNRMPEPNPRLFQPVFDVANMKPTTQVEVVPSAYFDVVVDGRADARVASAAPSLVGGASAGTQKAMGRRAKRRLPT